MAGLSRKELDVGARPRRSVDYLTYQVLVGLESVVRASGLELPRPACGVAREARELAGGEVHRVVLGATQTRCVDQLRHVLGAPCSLLELSKVDVRSLLEDGVLA